MDDSKIIELFFERSEQAIAELSEKYGKIIKKTAFNILGNEADAQECVNDAYLGVWNTVPPQSPDPLLTYVCRIVRNQAIKKYRSNTAAKRNSFYDAALDEIESCLPSGFSVEDEISAKALSEEINAFLSSISRENRIIFVKRYWFGEDTAEIANDMNLSRHNVTVKLSRTRQKLKKHLNEKGFGI